MIKLVIDIKVFEFDSKHCINCPLGEKSIHILKNGKFRSKCKRVIVDTRYDVVLKVKSRLKTEQFIKAYNKRYKVE